MLVTVMLAVLSILSALVGVWDKLASKVRRSIILGGIVLAIAITTQAILVAQKRELTEEIARKDRMLADANLLLKSNLIDVDEASGGASDGKTAYIVDDDEPFIFVFNYAEAENKYKLQKTMKIVDERPCDQRPKWDKDCKDAQPTELSNKIIEDLEGAALYNGKLYLTTAQSNSKNGKEEPQRWLFLEVSLDGKVLRSTTKLRDTIRESFKQGVPGVYDKSIEESYNEGGKLEVMQVEGLAIDGEGQIYLGLRNPLVNRKALVLRTNIQQVFNDKPQFESFLLDLERGGEIYGIVSLDYDPHTKQILVLGNHPMRSKTLLPAIWAWEVKDPKAIQQPTPYQGEWFTNFEAVGSRPAKPEVILLPQANRIHLFFDAEGTGGQLSLTREGANLSQSKR